MSQLCTQMKNDFSLYISFLECRKYASLAISPISVDPTPADRRPSNGAREEELF